MGCAPFRNCDMNVADGLSPTDFAAACGIATPVPPVITPVITRALTNAQPQDIANMLNGTNADGSPLIGPDGADYRRVDLLAADTEPLDESPNTTRSVLDQITTLSKILSRTTTVRHCSRWCPICTTRCDTQASRFEKAKTMSLLSMASVAVVRDHAPPGQPLTEVAIAPHVALAVPAAANQPSPGRPRPPHRPKPRAARGCRGHVSRLLGEHPGARAARWE